MSDATHSRSLREVVSVFLEKTILPGVGDSLSAVFQSLVNARIKVFLIGGCVRDIVRAHSECSKREFDFDIAFSTGADEVARVADLRGWTNFLSPEGLFVQIGDPNVRQHIEGMNERFSVRAEDEDRDFCLNCVYFDVENQEILDPTHRGVQDILMGRIRIPTARGEWDRWFFGDQTRKINKLFRFWKMLTEGYKCGHATREYMARKTRLVFRRHKSGNEYRSMAIETGKQYLYWLEQEAKQLGTPELMHRFLETVRQQMGDYWFYSVFCRCFARVVDFHRSSDLRCKLSFGAFVHWTCIGRSRICDQNDERNAIKSRIRQPTPGNFDLSNPVAYSMANPVSSPTLQEIFDEMESLMKNPRYPNYWKTVAGDHRKEIAKYTKQSLNVRDLGIYIKDMLDPISVPKSKINDLVDKAVRINKTHS
jgi:hypothetical protein